MIGETPLRSRTVDFCSARGMLHFAVPDLVSLEERREKDLFFCTMPDISLASCQNFCELPPTEARVS